MKRYHWVAIALLVISLGWPGKAISQSANPEALAAAKELMVTMRVGDQIEQMFPLVMQQLKPLVTKGNPLVERDYDALMPGATQGLKDHIDKFVDGGAKIYARHFSSDELRQLNAFMKTPAGQKFLQNQPGLMKEFMTLGQQIGGLVAQDMQARITNELRKRGHNI